MPIELQGVKQTAFTRHKYINTLRNGIVESVIVIPLAYGYNKRKELIHSAYKAAQTAANRNFEATYTIELKHE